MAFRFRKSFGGKGFRINLCKSGLPYSLGGAPFTMNFKPGRRTMYTASLPGTGISWRWFGGSRRRYSGSGGGGPGPLNYDWCSPPDPAPELPPDRPPPNPSMPPGRFNRIEPRLTRQPPTLEPQPPPESPLADDERRTREEAYKKHYHARQKPPHEPPQHEPYKCQPVRPRPHDPYEFDNMTYRISVYHNSKPKGFMSIMGEFMSDDADIADLVHT
jgi:hypothetical protein